MTRQEEDYLLERINSAFTQKWYVSTPEYMEDLERRRKEKQKAKLKSK